VLAEDKNLTRHGICNLLELPDRTEVIGKIEDVSEILEDLAKYKPDALVINIGMPKMTGTDTLKFLQEKNVMVPTIIRTTFYANQLLLDGMQPDAKGFLLKNVSLESLFNTIEKFIRVRPRFSQLLRHVY
jgi:DNA-binding NarL/FixJ family response regulator